MDDPTTITCVECGGTAHLVSVEPHEGFEPGQIVAFACEDCDHRMDITLEGVEDDEEHASSF